MIWGYPHFRKYPNTFKFIARQFCHQLVAFPKAGTIANQNGTGLNIQGQRLLDGYRFKRFNVFRECFNGTAMVLTWSTLLGFWIGPGRSCNICSFTTSRSWFYLKLKVLGFDATSVVQHNFRPMFFVTAISSFASGDSVAPVGWTVEHAMQVT